jgi:hypothetical protein
MTPRVITVVEPVLASLGAVPDPTCWVVWGDDPGVRYAMLVPTEAGLLQVLVRVNVPGEGPRASGKVIRWSRVQVGELALEMANGHRLVGFQVESHVLRGADADGDNIASFALELFARIDGRPFTPRTVKRAQPIKAGTAGAGAAKPAARKTASATRKPPARKASS